MTISELLDRNTSLFNEHIHTLLDTHDADYPVIFDAVRYSAENGGKRIRPFLTLEFCRMCNGADEDALTLGCALELIHTYSLIHDDLPCMDNDDLRRGKPTNHKVFGEAVATLAGDALLTYAFEITAGSSLKPELRLRAIREMSYNAGMHGMIGGQVLDLMGEENKLDTRLHMKMNSLKTGALIKTAVFLGLCAAENTVSVPRQLYHDAEIYAQRIGLAFQIVDDILDVCGDEAVFGKPIGSDAENGKTTFTTLYTTQGARRKAEELTDEAVSSIKRYDGSESLVQLAYLLLNRNK